MGIQSRAQRLAFCNGEQQAADVGDGPCAHESLAWRMVISTRNLGSSTGYSTPKTSSFKLWLCSMRYWRRIGSTATTRSMFNAHWAKDQMMGSMRNGQGDEFFALFKTRGAFPKGFARESQMARMPGKHFYRANLEVAA